MAKQVLKMYRGKDLIRELEADSKPEAETLKASLRGTVKGVTKILIEKK